MEEYVVSKMPYDELVRLYLKKHSKTHYRHSIVVQPGKTSMLFYLELTNTDATPITKENWVNWYDKLIVSGGVYGSRVIVPFNLYATETSAQIYYAVSGTDSFETKTFDITDESVVITDTVTEV